MTEDETRALAAKLDEAANADCPGGSPQRIARLQLILNEALGVVVSEPPKPPVLPRWRSHKIVSADKIIGVQAPPDTYGAVVDRWVLECGIVVDVHRELAARAQGQILIGGYYVRYADGFQSWAPAAAFEEGYTLLDDDANFREVDVAPPAVVFRRPECLWEICLHPETCTDSCQEPRRDGNGTPLKA